MPCAIIAQTMKTYFYNGTINSCLKAHNQSLLKLMDAILTDTSKLPGWLTHAVKRAFVAGVVTIMCLALRVHFGAPSKDTFHV